MQLIITETNPANPVNPFNQGLNPGFNPGNPANPSNPWLKKPRLVASRAGGIKNLEVLRLYYRLSQRGKPTSSHPHGCSVNRNGHALFTGHFQRTINLKNVDHLVKIII